MIYYNKILTRTINIYFSMSNGITKISHINYYLNFSYIHTIHIKRNVINFTLNYIIQKICILSCIYFFSSYGNEVTCSMHLCRETQQRRYINAFDIYLEILAKIWYDISRRRSFDCYCQKKHLL